MGDIIKALTKEQQFLCDTLHVRMDSVVAMLQRIFCLVPPICEVGKWPDLPSLAADLVCRCHADAQKAKELVARIMVKRGVSCVWRTKQCCAPQRSKAKLQIIMLPLVSPAEALVFTQEVANEAGSPGPHQTSSFGRPSLESQPRLFVNFACSRSWQKEASVQSHQRW